MKDANKKCLWFIDPDFDGHFIEVDSGKYMTEDEFLNWIEYDFSLDSPMTVIRCESISFFEVSNKVSLKKKSINNLLKPPKDE